MGVRGGFWKIVHAFDNSRTVVDFKNLGKDVVVAVDGFVWLHQLCAVHIVDVMQVCILLVCVPSIFFPSSSPISCLPSHPLSIIAETRCYESGGKFHAALAPYAFEWVSVCGVS